MIIATIVDVPSNQQLNFQPGKIVGVDRPVCVYMIFLSVYIITIYIQLSYGADTDDLLRLAIRSPGMYQISRH